MKYPYLDKIQKNGDVKKLPQQELPLLCEDIRNFLIESVSSTGGHLSSNLGVVELTVALHRALTLPQDKILFDVGHQCYTHKLLTGRREGFAHLRQVDGLSGFPSPQESDCDTFIAGHRHRGGTRQKAEKRTRQGRCHHRGWCVHRRHGV